MDFEKIVLDKLDKIENKQVEHTIELAKNTVILLEHHVRSSNLEARFKPLEASHIFWEKMARVVAVGSTVITVLAGILTLYFKLK